jgi:phosphodiesterase/alkaline phosphatase D-like protein
VGRYAFESNSSYSSTQKLTSTFPDHEVQNDFPDIRPSNIKHANGRASFENAIDYAWQKYMGGGNPISYPGRTWFEFDYGDVAFFFPDTRVNRTTIKLPDGPDKTILGSEQKAHLKAWLLAKNSTAKFKFILSPLAITYDFPSVADSWGGFKTERDEIFDFIRDNRIEGVAYFTGDSHFAYAVELGGRPGGIQGGLYEFSASPISAFDATLGGALSSETFKAVEEREDELIFETIARKGPISLLGLARVDTTKAVPELAVDFYDGTQLIYTVSLNMTQMRHWASPN